VHHRGTGKGSEAVQLELSMDVLCRLLRERSLVASDFRGLNARSNRAGWQAVKASLVPCCRSAESFENEAY
jgi:hypothetical protein